MRRNTPNGILITDAEDILARHLHELGVSYIRQYCIGPFVADFLVPPNIVVEAEGLSHSDRIERDVARTEFLEALGYRVFRIPNQMIYSDPKGVAEMISIQRKI